MNPVRLQFVVRPKISSDHSQVDVVGLPSDRCVDVHLALLAIALTTPALLLDLNVHPIALSFSGSLLHGVFDAQLVGFQDVPEGQTAGAIQFHAKASPP